MYFNTETQRLNIRPIQASDADFMLQLVNTEGWLKFIGDRNIKNSQEAKLYIQKILANTRFFYSVFELKTTQQAIGIISFLEREQQTYPDIGFAILPEFGANGYAFEACKTYLDLILELDKYENIIGITMPKNKPSIALLTKLGLSYQSSYTENNTILSKYTLK